MARHRTFPPSRSLAASGPSGLRRVLFHTFAGRLVIVGVTIRLIVIAAALGGSLPAFFNVIDTVAGLAIAIGVGYFVVRLFVALKRRLLWRVRRKLILSYIFIGFVPAILIVSFFLLGGFLLFNNLSTYLVQSRLRALGDEARFLAQTTALEVQRTPDRDVDAVIARRQRATADQYPLVSVAVMPVARQCDAGAGGPLPQRAELGAHTAGPWAHAEPPRTLPDWIGCAGFGGVLAYAHATGGSDPEVHLLLRGVAFPDAQRPTFAVVVDVPITDVALQRLRQETGVDLQHLSTVRDAAVKPLPGSPRADTEARPAQNPATAPLNWVTQLDYTDWNSGRQGFLTGRILLSVGDVYDRISGAKEQGGTARTMGQTLLLMLKIIGALFLLIEALALIAGLTLAKSITGSIHELFLGTERVRQGDFGHRMPVSTDDQLGQLTDSFNSMTASIEDLLREAAEKKRLEEELRIAHEIQMSLLPQGPLQMPGLSVTALCVPAREVGGDYYDFLPLDDQRVGVLIADVSGKGTSAALYMAELKGLILSLSRIHRSPRELLINANRLIAEHLDARSFITMTYAVLDLRAKTMTYARAGHTPLIYLPGVDGRSDRRVRILAPDGLVLGLKIDNGETFERLLQEQTIPLHADDLYLFFTDGITEAMNDRDDFFGENRLGQIIEDHAHLPSAELRERLLREIEAFVGAAPQHDDMTLILLKVEQFEDDKNAAEPSETPEFAEPR